MIPRILPAVSNHPNRGRGNIGRNPTPAEILRAREAAGLTQSQAAALVYRSLRAWQAWEGEEGSNLRRMPPDTWELFQVKVKLRGMTASGELTPELVRAIGIYLPPL